MKNKNFIIIILIILLFSFLISCKEENNYTESSEDSGLDNLISHILNYTSIHSIVQEDIYIVPLSGEEKKAVCELLVLMRGQTKIDKFLREDGRINDGNREKIKGLLYIILSKVCQDSL